MTKYLKALVFFSFLSLFVVAGFSQEATSVKGNIAGTVADTSGAVVPDAKVTVTGPEGTRIVTSDAGGRFEARALTPGFYTVAVEKAGFRKYENKNIEVVTNRTSGVNAALQPGQVSETVEVNAAAIAVDTTSTAVGANLPDTFYQQIPVQRGVASLFYVAPGVASGGGSGTANPSISGGSGLENQYVADGVNITDTAFGGLGSFSRVFGSLGTGINLAFIKEVQVKTGGFEPQYGKATGGIVQIVTKSGGDAFHGQLAVYGAPRWAEGTYRQPDDFRLNKQGKYIHQANYEGDAELGGYIPGFKEHLFFFASVDPSILETYQLAASNSGLFSHGEFKLDTTTYNYASKLTARLGQNHQLEASLFGDPSRTNRGPYRTLVTDNDITFSRLHFGGRELVTRYNGTLSPTWLVNSSWTYNHNTVSEGGFPNVYNIVDRTQTGGLPGQRGAFTAQGLGVFENSKTDNYGFNVDTSKIFKAFGQHTVTVGYRYERPNYLDFLDRSGDRFPLPATNAAGLPAPGIGPPANNDVGALTDASFQLKLAITKAGQSCPTNLCPLMNVPGFATPQQVILQQTRGTFSSPNIPTHARYHAGYANDVYSPNKYVTFDLGLRWEQYRMIGTIPSLTYTFTDNWSPRLGVSIDPFGDRKTKIFFNYGRYDYVLPLDVAIRSLSNELDTIGERWAPESVGGNVVIGPNGTVVPVLDAAHLLNGVPGTPFAGNPVSDSASGFEAISPGTKQEYEDEYVLGFERQLPWSGLVLSARYTDRRLIRIIEDTGGISPEAANAGIVQNFTIANVGAGTDLFVNPVEFIYPSGGAIPSGCPLTPKGVPVFGLDPVTDSLGNTVAPGAACFGTTAANGGVPGAIGADGIPDGFSNAVRRYQSLEVELNKSFSHNFTARINYRYAKLFGNFEGAFRNDNGQTDPGISSLFDFTPGQFGLLGGQFTPGYLNTDRRNVGNFYVAYSVPSTMFRGLTIGTGIRGESGTPINRLAAHPVYFNAGEVPLGGRGSIGRTPSTVEGDVHADYPFKTSENSRLRLGIDLFNVTNTRHVVYFDQNIDLGFGVPNTDFLTPSNVGVSVVNAARGTGFERPFNARASIKFEF